MKYDFDKITDRKGTDCLKYDFAKERGRHEGILPLWVADMDFPTLPQVSERLRKITEHGIYGYSDAKEPYFQALLGWYEKHFSWKIQKEWLIKTPGVVFALAAAVLVGLLNAFITVRIGVPAFVGTMAIRSLLSGAISFLTNNTIFYSNNWGETYKLLGQGKIRNVIPYCCLIFLVICVACYIFLEHTKTGRYIYATGANRSAAKNVGIPVVRMQVLSFAIGALLAGIGGILHSSRNFQTSVQMGIDLQLPAQICCLLGATYKTPGKYNVPGCVVGILLTTIITNGVYGTIGSSIYIKSLVEGLVFMTAIGIIATIRQEGLPKVKFDI